MTEVQMREAVSALFAASWPTASGGVPLALENEALPSADTFAQLTILPTTSQQMTHGRSGKRRVRRNGWIQVKLWGPVDRGAEGLADLGDAAQAILEMVAIPSPVAGDDPVTTQAAMAGSAQGAVDGRWYMAVTRIPFWYVETK